jgi:preprotein translocase subunit YajC
VRIDAHGGLEVEPAGFFPAVVAGLNEVVVHVILASSSWSMQPEPSSTAAAPSAQTGSPSPAPRGGMSGIAELLWPMLLMFGIFYFLILRPQQKRQRETDDMLKALKKGDKVRTSGGIRGEVVELNEAEVWLQIADKVKINVLRSHIAARAEKTATESKEEAKPTAG